MEEFRQYLLMLFLLINLTNCTKINSQTDAMKYLKKFGYLPNEVVFHATNFRLPLGDKKMFSKGLSTFQLYAGLNPSGKLDEETKVMMNMPRCGMAERMGIMENKNLKLNDLSHKIPRRKGWKASRIYYRVDNFPTSSEIDPDTVREEIRRAFRMWEQVANLQCIEINNDDQHAQIDINFWSKEHGDGIAFGQKSFGNIVAHAFFPDHREYEGDIHFDNERLWTAFNTSGVNLFQVAAHEIGHALGLDHSRFNNSVMHMIVQSELNEDFKLHEDDIKGIQKLYGPPRKQRHSWSAVHSTADSNEGFQVDTHQNDGSGNTHVNMVITVPMKGGDVDKFSPLEQSLAGFWTCFSLSHSSNDRATDCYKQNVLRLLYSLKIV